MLPSAMLGPDVNMMLKQAQDSCCSALVMVEVLQQSHEQLHRLGCCSWLPMTLGSIWTPTGTVELHLPLPSLHCSAPTSQRVQEEEVNLILVTPLGHRLGQVLSSRIPPLMTPMGVPCMAGLGSWFGSGLL